MNRTELGGRFWSLWATFSAANLADGFSLVAFPLLSVAVTDDARAIAVVAMSRFLPFLVLALPAGVMLDRVDRRLASIVALGGRALVMAMLTAILIRGPVSITVLALAAFAVGLGEVVADSGIPAMVQSVVEAGRLEVANSRISGAGTVTNVFVGPPVGAALYGVDPGLVMGATGGLYLLATVLMTALRGRYRPRTPEPEPDPETGRAAGADPIGRLGVLRRDLTVGLRFVWDHPVLRPLALAVGVLAFFGRACNAVFVIIVTDRFGFEGFEFGLLVAVDGISSVAMSFLVAGLVRRTNHSFSMRFSLGNYIVAAFLFSLSPLLAAAVISGLLYGVAEPTWNVVTTTVRQRLVPPEIFGRMMTAYLFIAWGAQPLGALFGGLVAEQWGAPLVYFLSGLAAIGLFLAGRPMFTRIDTALGTHR